MSGCQTWQEGLVMCNSGISCCRWAVAPWNTSQLRSGCGLGGFSWPDALHLVLDTGCSPFSFWIGALRPSLTMIVYVNVVWLWHTRQSLLIQVFRPERGDWNVAAVVLEVVQNCTKILPWRGIKIGGIDFVFLFGHNFDCILCLYFDRSSFDCCVAAILG